MNSVFKLIFVSTFLLVNFRIFGQDKNDQNKFTVIVINDSVKTPAYFPGGKDSLDKFVSQYYKIDRKGSCSFPNNIRIRFTVDENGEIANIEYIKPADIDAYNETVRFIESMPKWNPASVNGKPTKSTVSLHFLR